MFGGENDMSGNSTIGELITTLRSRNRMSQKELADFLYVDQSTVSRWERGIRFPDTEIILKMAERFNVDASELFLAPLTSDDVPEVLIVEDEPLLLNDFCETVRATLSSARVMPFRWASDALAYAKTRCVGLAFLDIELVGGNGLDLARELLRCNPRCNIIFLTSHPEYAREALDLFCSGYIMKPLSPSKIRTQVRNLRHSVPGLTVTEYA